MPFKSPSVSSLTRRMKRTVQQAITKHPVDKLPDDLLRNTFEALSLKPSTAPSLHARTSSNKFFPFALSLVQEAAFRSLGLRPFETQLMAASVLFDGVVAEMKTGEGKTLAIALAAAIATKTHQSVHIATPNPYLAARDCEAMRPFYESLGLTVGVTLPGQKLQDKQMAYRCNVVYGVHSEFAFDYLRDNLVLDLAHRVQRGLHFVIVDEADSILIDEARTPLIISEQSDEQIDLVLIADGTVRQLIRSTHVTVDEKEKTALLTDSGFERLALELKARGLISQESDLYKPETLPLMRAVEASLRAHFVYQLDKDYVIQGSQALIIDEATGRILSGRRWQEGVHQAIEAKEKLPVRSETQTTAEITYQSYFGLYQHLSGLTGTALSSSEEFLNVYGRKTLEIPTHLPCIREDRPDILFANREEKFKAIVDEAHRCHEKEQPVLIGTGSVAESEALSKWLSWAGLPHQVLNARQNANEAQVIAEAGLPGAITVATNMAGRGTDIVLGGHREDSAQWLEKHNTVLAAGGLHVIGTQRHESRRTDNQLRGRAGRQGDPGSSQFFLSLDDELIRIFGARYFENLGRFLGKENGQGVSGPFLNKVIRKAQKALEERNFSAREQLFKFDGVISRQREAVYALRNSLLDGTGVYDFFMQSFTSVAQELIESYADEEGVKLSPVSTAFSQLYGLNLDLSMPDTLGSASPQAVKAQILEQALKALRLRYGLKPGLVSATLSRASLKAIDGAWREHLTTLDAIREGIHLRSMAQESPVHAFAIEAYRAFEAFTQRYSHEVVLAICTEGRVSDNSQRARQAKKSRLSRCLCGSGLRYKHCHGRLPVSAKARLFVRPVTSFKSLAFKHKALIE